MMRAMTTERAAQSTIESGPERTPEEAAEIRAGLLRFQADCLYLADQRPELLREFEDQWIGVHARAVFHAPTLDGLLVELRSNGVNPGSTVVEYLTRQPMIVLHW
jgi:1,6-anhydro-N-acetylmuramate kinase